jgi:glutamate-1-semialdehyde 2,1-aminomutase
MGVNQQSRTKSVEIFSHNREYIPGGVVSMARKVEPEIAFSHAEGSYMWDVDDNRYIDCHAAFGIYVLGHNDPHVTESVQRVLKERLSLFGTGTNRLEGRLAELLCTHIPACERVQILNTGTEATMSAIRLARAATGRDHIVVIQGGFNGSHNDVACNVMTPLDEIGPRVSPGEYRYFALGPGIPSAHQQLVHVINFNDLDSLRYVCERYSIAALITEPILQNVGVLKPQPGYLEGLRELADRFGFALIFDEVKTGFRSSVAGYSQISGVKPDLVVFAKALANGYPISVLGGKQEIMELLADPQPSRRPLLAGTYNGHPVPVAAAIATIERLLENGGEIYRHLEGLGNQVQDGIDSLIRSHGVKGVLSRQGSAFCLYFMDHEPRDWHDLAAHHDFALDVAMRRRIIEDGVYFFPVAAKQCSISYAHSRNDIAYMLEMMDKALRALGSSGTLR